MTTLLRDPVRAVRVEAARALAGVDPKTLAPAQQMSLAGATMELIASELVDAERPEAHLNLGLLDVRRREPAAAEAEYRTALRLDPGFIPAMVNLADLDRMRGQDQQGIDLLHTALTLEPGNADVHHALGLLLVRQHDYTGALAELRRANQLAPDNARYAYVYAIALNSTGAVKESVELLEQTHRQHPTDAEVLVALLSIARDRGDFPAALQYAKELAVISPDDPQLRALIHALKSRQP